MGDLLNLPKPLTQLSSPPPPPPPPLPSHRSNMPMLYYGLVVVATAAIVLAIYNLIIVRWCATQYRRSREPNHQLFGRATRNNNAMSLPQSSSLSRGGSTIGLTTSFRYKKGTEETDKTRLDYDTECSVCLSGFEDGEEVRKLPRCNHSFHASCIDMWLYSHFDCPLCRAPVTEPPPHGRSLTLTPQHRHTDSGLSEHSRDELLDRAGSSV